MIIHKYHVFIFPKGKQSTIYVTKLYRHGVKGFVDDITSHRGANGISCPEVNTHLEDSKGDDDHDSSCREVLEDAIE